MTYLRRTSSLLVVVYIFVCPTLVDSTTGSSGDMRFMRGQIDKIVSLGIVYATAMRECKNNLDTQALTRHTRKQIERLMRRTYLFLEKRLDPTLQKFILMDKGYIPPNIDALYMQMIINIREQKQFMHDWCALLDASEAYLKQNNRDKTRV